MNVICRHASDDFDALLTAQGMEEAGANVFSIVWLGKPGTTMAFGVYATYDRYETSPEDIDKLIDKYRSYGPSNP